MGLINTVVYGGSTPDSVIFDKNMFQVFNFNDAGGIFYETQELEDALVEFEQAHGIGRLYNILISVECDRQAIIYPLLINENNVDKWPGYGIYNFYGYEVGSIKTLSASIPGSEFSMLTGERPRKIMLYSEGPVQAVVKNISLQVIQ